MDIYIGKGEKQKEFIDLVQDLKCIASREKLLNNGFRNDNKNYLYFFKFIGDYITFNISINSDTLKINNIQIIDEDFGQPFLATEEVYNESKKIIDDLISKKLFVNK